MDSSALQATFADHFAPWVLVMGLRMDEVKNDSVVLRLPYSTGLSRSGGTLCGQAMMAAADTAFVVALIQHYGAFNPCTTVLMSSSFLKPLSNSDA